MGDVNINRIEEALSKKVKGLEISICQVLGLVDPHFQRVINTLLNEHKQHVIDIVKHETAIDEGGKEK